MLGCRTVGGHRNLPADSKERLPDRVSIVTDRDWGLGAGTRYPPICVGPRTDADQGEGHPDLGILRADPSVSNPRWHVSCGRAALMGDCQVLAARGRGELIPVPG
jgi:hypothetical protein